MKILLINPPWIYLYGKYTPAAKVGVNMPPLGLLYIAAHLKANGFNEIEIIDAEATGYSIEKVKAARPDIIGITSVSPNFESACVIARQIKKEFNVPIVLGGVHVTVATQNAFMQCEAFDYGVIGEGEATAVELFKALASKTDISTIEGIAYRKNGAITINKPRKLIENLDALPFPDRSLIVREKYNFSVPKEGVIPLTMMETSRGCPFNCIFCASKTIWGRSTRFRSADNVVKEIREILGMGIRYIAFSDDTFTLNRQRVIDICNRIIENKLVFKWQMMTRANLFDEDLLRLMKKAGLVRMSIGIESGDPDILLKIKKGVTLDEIKEGYAIAARVGIETRGSIMLGHPYETKESAMRTLHFVRSLTDCKQLYINVSTPYPGTELLEMAKRNEGGLTLLTDDLSEYRRYGNAVVNVNDLDRDQLIKMQKLGFWLFYMTPARIYYNIFRAGLRAGMQNVRAFIKSLIH